MKTTVRSWWLALGVIAIGALFYISQNGIYPRYFDLEWDEEVQLHDGRVIVVHVRNTYERRTQSFTRYVEARITFRRKTLIFEIEPGKRITFSTRLPVAYLGQFGTNWFLVLSTQGPYGNYPDEMPNRWGNDFTTLEQRLALLKSDTFEPVSWDMAPPELNSMNMMESGFYKDFLEWNNGLLNLTQKSEFFAKYPTPYMQQITRPLNAPKNQGVLQ